MEGLSGWDEKADVEVCMDRVQVKQIEVNTLTLGNNVVKSQARACGATRHDRPSVRPVYPERV